MPQKKWVIKTYHQALYYCVGNAWSRNAYDALLFDDFHDARRFGLKNVTRQFKIINIMISLPRTMEEAYDEAMKGVK